MPLLPVNMADDSEYRQAIKVKIILFGSLAELFRRKNIDIAVEFGTTVNQLISRFQLSNEIVSGINIAIDGQIIDDLETQLIDMSEIALMPPFSGG